MLFVSAEDFLHQASTVNPLSCAEETELACRMAAGDAAAREALVRGCFPLIASLIRRAPSEIRTLHTVYACIAAAEKGVDRFDVLQDSAPFVHHLSWSLRQCLVRCLADQHGKGE